MELLFLYCFDITTLQMLYRRGLSIRGQELLVQKSRAAFILNFSLPLFLYPTHFKKTCRELNKNTRKNGQMILAIACNTRRCLCTRRGETKTREKAQVFLCSKMKIMIGLTSNITCRAKCNCTIHKCLAYKLNQVEQFTKCNY